MADNDEKTIQQKMAELVVAGLGSVEEVSNVFHPSQFGLRAGDGTIIVVMDDGAQYRVNITVKQAD